MLISTDCLYLYIYQTIQRVEQFLYYIKFISFLLFFHNFQTNYSLCFFLSLLILIYPSTDKPYPPAILVKHHTWFLQDADLFISCDHILYGVHQSYFDQPLLFIQYGRTNEIGVNPYHPIPFDTLIKEVFNNLLHVLYFGTEHLEHITPEDWLNIKRLSTDWHFP
jgi:hypothetical protein